MLSALQLHLKYNANALAKGTGEMHAQDKQTANKALYESYHKETLGAAISIDSEIPLLVVIGRLHHRALQHQAHQTFRILWMTHESKAYT